MVKIKINGNELIEKIQMRDIIALVVISFIFILIAVGRNSYLYPTLAIIIGYYFSKRVYEETNKKKRVM